ncbi:hypothetical protein DUNSADRAFT_3275 [Dunaliella salina]|uniref:Encoded protein n=1 Tax=Dunaliella salina TaxID=3046 RepID=A0ABQ7FVJ1_DUNSA|nr:hypothetical protein DUNSADRAFT_3275 [Dunaliella salina]|eukprot:KAF5826404.1 hypothetical protein DUNSADRAFT_3275 [Dunaliella salina]
MKLAEALMYITIPMLRSNLFDIDGIKFLLHRFSSFSWLSHHPRGKGSDLDCNSFGNNLEGLHKKFVPMTIHVHNHGHSGR